MRLRVALSLFDCQSLLQWVCRHWAKGRQQVLIGCAAGWKSVCVCVRVCVWYKVGGIKCVLQPSVIFEVFSFELIEPLLLFCIVNEIIKSSTVPCKEVLGRSKIWLNSLLRYEKTFICEVLYRRWPKIVKHKPSLITIDRKKERENMNL